MEQHDPNQTDQPVDNAEPEINTNQAIDFLRAMHGKRNIHLVAIGEKGPLVAKTFDNQPSEEIAKWITTQNNRKRNIYWHVNELKPGIRNRRAGKADVAQVVMFQIDVDDSSQTALERLKTFNPRPTAIIFSGGGYQAFWLLDTPMDDIAKAEGINEGLASRLGGDNCQNIDRIMRVPGTINWPNAKKREEGRVPASAYVL